MIEYNDDKYKAFIRFWLYKLKCIYICQCLCKATSNKKLSSSSSNSISAKSPEATKSVTGNTTTSDLYVLPKNNPQQQTQPKNTESHLNQAILSQNTTIEGDRKCVQTPIPDKNNINDNDSFMTTINEHQFPETTEIEVEIIGSLNGSKEINK